MEKDSRQSTDCLLTERHRVSAAVNEPVETEDVSAETNVSLVERQTHVDLFKSIPNTRNTPLSLMYLDDAALRSLASEMGSEWRKLASYLGINSYAVERLVADNKSTEESAFKMLVTWRQRSIEGGNTTGTPVHLQNALMNAERCDLAENLEERLRQNGRAGECPHSHRTKTRVERHVPKENTLRVSLDEFHHFTRNLENSDRLGKTMRLPNFEADHLDYNGGVLDIPKYNVHLYIPQGAIPSGMVQEIYVHVGQATVQDVPSLPTSKTILAPLVKFGPPGLKFTRSVILHFPCFAIEGGPNWSKAVDQYCSDDYHQLQKHDWGHLGADKNSNVIIKDKQVIMILDKFCKHSLDGIPAIDHCDKTLKACATAPVFNSSDGCFQFHVVIWNANKDIIGSDSSVGRLGARTAAEDIEVSWDRGDLELHLKNLLPGVKAVSGNGVYITKESLWKDQMPKVTFQLQDDCAKASGNIKSTRIHLCDISFRQSSDDSEHACVLLPIYLRTVKDNASEESHIEEHVPPNQPEAKPEKETTLEIPPSMRNWEEDDVRIWLLHIGLPGPLVSKFYAARVVGEKLAGLSDEDLLRDFQMSKNERELILCSRDGWLEQKQTTDLKEKEFEIAQDLQSSTSVTRNDAWFDTDESKIRFGDDTSEYTNSVDLPVTVDVLTVPEGAHSKKAMETISDMLRTSLRLDGFSETVMAIGNIFNEHSVELRQLEGATCLVRFQSKEGLDSFREICSNGELATKLSEILITDKVKQTVGCDLTMRLTFNESDYIKGIQAF